MRIFFKITCIGRPVDSVFDIKVHILDILGGCQLLIFIAARQGVAWQRYRSAINQHMMRPQNVATHTEDIRGICQDFMTLLELRTAASSDGEVKGLKDLLFRWSLEGI